MAITTNLKKSDGVDLGNNLFAGNGTSNGNQTFGIIQSNGVDLGKGWYRYGPTGANTCKSYYGNVGFKNSAGTDVGTLLGKYGTLNCTCDTDIDVCDTDACDTDSDGCFVYGHLLTQRGLVHVAGLVVGDRIWGADEKWYEVRGVAVNILGRRQVYTLMGGGVVTDDHIVYAGDSPYVPSKKSLNKHHAVLVADNGVEGIYGVPAQVTELDGASLTNLPFSTKTYSPICEKSFVGYLNGDRVLIAGKV